MPKHKFQVTASKLLLAFCISLSSNTENPGSKHHSCLPHFHLHLLFRTEKCGLQKPHKAVCLQRGSSTRVFGVCVCTRARVCVQATLQLETHCWISPESRKSLYKRHAGIMLPVICLTSVFFAGVSLPSRLSCWSGEQPVLSREGSCLAGATGSGPREEKSTGIFWRRLSVPHASSWTCA